MADPRPRLDAETMARTESHHSYQAIIGALSVYSVQNDMAVVEGAFDDHLGNLSTFHLMSLIDRIAWRCIHWQRSEYAWAVDEGRAMRPNADIPCLMRLLERCQMDQEGWDFVGSSVFGALVHALHADPIEPRVGAVRAVAALVLSPLVRAHPLALRLDWNRVRERAIAWAARGSRVYQIGSASEMSVMATWTLTPQLRAIESVEAAMREAWDAPIRDAERDMRREAHEAQNELRREPRLPSDITGMVAQFIAPPATSPADLKKQRDFYRATIGVAKLQVQADRSVQAHRMGDPAPASLYEVAQARAAAHGRPGEYMTKRMPQGGPANPPTSAARANAYNGAGAGVGRYSFEEAMAAAQAASAADARVPRYTERKEEEEEEKGEGEIEYTPNSPRYEPYEPVAGASATDNDEAARLHLAAHHARHAPGEAYIDAQYRAMRARHHAAAAAAQPVATYTPTSPSYEPTAAAASAALGPAPMELGYSTDSDTTESDDDEGYNNKRPRLRGRPVPQHW